MIPVMAAAEPASAPRDIQHYMRAGMLQLAALPPLSLYVHLPWCLKKCPYCDFNSHEMRAAALPEQRYLDALMADLEAALPLIWVPDRNLREVQITRLAHVSSSKISMRSTSPSSMQR